MQDECDGDMQLKGRILSAPTEWLMINILNLNKRGQGMGCYALFTVSQPVFLFLYGFGRLDKREFLQIKESQQRRQLQSFLTSFVFNNYNTNNETCNGNKNETNSQRPCQFFKKITCKSYSNNSFAQIAENFSDEFNNRLINGKFYNVILSIFDNLSILINNVLIITGGYYPSLQNI